MAQKPPRAAKACVRPARRGINNSTGGRDRRAGFVGLDGGRQNLRRTTICSTVCWRRPTAPRRSTAGDQPGSRTAARTRQAHSSDATACVSARTRPHALCYAASLAEPPVSVDNSRDGSAAPATRRRAARCLNAQPVRGRICSPQSQYACGSNSSHHAMICALGGPIVVFRPLGGPLRRGGSLDEGCRAAPLIGGQNDRRPQVVGRVQSSWGWHSPRAHRGDPLRAEVRAARG